MLSETTQSQSSKRSKTSGFSLVEILIYMVIFSLISVGITTLIIQMQRSSIMVQTLSAEIANEDLAFRSIQLKLGRADDLLVDSVGPDDKACLRLKRNKYQMRTGLRFNGDDQYIKSNGVMPIVGAAARSVSFWVWFEPEKRGKATVVKWGTPSNNRTMFDISVDDGFIKIDLGCVSHNFTAEPLSPRQWHHIVVTYSGADTMLDPEALKLFINNSPVNLYPVFSTPCGGVNSLLNTAISFLYVGNRSDNRETMFTGSIGDLKVWNAVLSSENIVDIYYRNRGYESLLAENLKLHWAFDDGAGSIVQNKAFVALDGVKMNFPPMSPIYQTARKKEQYEGFCFLDSHNDGLHAVWHGKDIVGLPSTAGEEGWEKILKENFVPSSRGFFEKVGTNANSVVANFTSGKIANGDLVTSKQAKSVKLAANTRLKLTNICKIARPANLSASGCTFKKAYVSIVGNHNPNQDRLDYKGNVDKLSITSLVTFQINKYDIPTLGQVIGSDNITGTWHGPAGVMSFVSNGPAMDITSWRQVLNDIDLKVVGDEFTTTKTIRYSLGSLAHVENDVAYFHEFIPAGNGVNSYPFSTAVAASSQPTNLFCGLQPYLSTITSEAENAVFEKIHDINPVTVGGGWIGASYNTNAQQNWRWMNGPDNGTVFWNSYGPYGRPVYEDTGVQEANTNNYYTFGYDHLINKWMHEYKREVKPILANRNFRYSNFSFGTNPNYCHDLSCEPYPLPPVPQNLTFQDSDQGDYIWHASNQIDANCDPYNPNKVCGYYREFGGMLGDPTTVKLYDDVVVDIRKHADLCDTTF